jgi:hypothetical protein
MPDNMIETTGNSLQSSRTHYHALRTVGEYQWLALISLATVATHIILIGLFTSEERKFLKDNPDKCRIPGATFWGGLLGYSFGMAFSFYVLNQIKEENDKIIFQIVEDQQDNSLLNGLELRDPVIGVELPFVLALCTGFTTAFGITAANLGYLAYTKCKEKLPTLNAYKAFCENKHHPMHQDEAEGFDIEKLTPSARP